MLTSDTIYQVNVHRYSKNKKFFKLTSNYINGNKSQHFHPSRIELNQITRMRNYVYIAAVNVSLSTWN